jgi:HEAT repeat protein
MWHVLFWLAVLALVLWRHALQDPEWGQKWPDRELPAPSDRERALLSAVGPLPSGLSLSMRHLEWAKDESPGSQTGTRLVVKGVCPQISVSVGDGVDIEVGDAALDGMLSLMGPPPLVRAMLDGPARGALLALARSPSRARSLRIRDGELRIDTVEGNVGELERLARLALTAAARLRQAPADVPARLAANAREDHDPAVRRSNLQTLVREFPDHALTAPTIRAASEDGDGEVRLAAARAMGEEGRPVLLALARDTAVDDACSAHAIDALGDGSLAELGTILEAAHRAPYGGQAPWRPHTARACVEALSRLGEDAVPLLDVTLGSENEAVALATIRALGRIGGPAVVIPLQVAADHHRGDVRQAAETALGDVQARLKGTPGQISLSAGDSGQVSLADDAAGQVSLERAPEAPAPPAPQRRRLVE